MVDLVIDLVVPIGCGVVRFVTSVHRYCQFDIRATASVVSCALGVNLPPDWSMGVQRVASLVGERAARRLIGLRVVRLLTDLCSRI